MSWVWRATKVNSNRLKISLESLEKERLTQEQIYASIDGNEKIVFNAGAGAGKTYALVESLRYILERHSGRLQKNNQKVICVTYTNVAVNEIKERLGNSSLVRVSTIHELLWELIKRYQAQLLIIHKKNLNDKLDKVRLERKSDAQAFKAYNALSEDLQKKFVKFMVENRDRYYNNNSNAGEVRAAFSKDLNPYVNILKNIGNFKKLVSNIYKEKDFLECLEKIDNGEKKYTRINYDSKRNRDSLHKMRISHDTLLEYACKIICEYSTLKQIIIDCYPYILVDEYQDTNPQVIKIMQMLDDYSFEIDHDIFIGYFGDDVQNIYDDGVGGHLSSLHPGLREINKEFNRRSTIEVINTINKIRSDKIEQRSIYDNFGDGSVKFYQLSSGNKDEAVSAFIERYQTKWNIGEEHKLHCLVLTNKVLSELAGFKNIYRMLSQTPYYKVNYNQLNTELLSSQTEKLGVVPLCLYNILNLKALIGEGDTSIIQLIDKKTVSTLSFTSLSESIHTLQNIAGKTLREVILSIFSIYDDTSIRSIEPVRAIINRFLDIEELSFKGINAFLLENLNPNLDYDEKDQLLDAQGQIDNFLDIDIAEWGRWFGYITKKENTSTLFHTYHGTKGLEFENVLIFMENDFGRERNKFPRYFENIMVKDSLSGEDWEQYSKTKNLFYVSCSRAIKNLRILYLDDVTSFQDGIKSIFSEVNDF